jgi:leader peptidase (prepilin peptidase)/N-methyltransferase
MLGWALPVASGPFIGSFLGVLIRRLPADRPVAAARSCCDACGHRLGPLEMIPLASFVWQGGRCRHCGAPIARFHLGVELAALGVAAVAALVVPGGAYPGDPLLWVTCALGWWLLALGWIDAETFRLPDGLTLPLILAGLAEAWVFDREAIYGRAQGAALAAVSLIVLALIYKRLRKRAGLGMGDAKLLAAGGAWVGVGALPWVMMVGAVSALGWAGVMRLRGARLTATTKLPFGPFLAAGIWVCWLVVTVTA